MAALGESQLGGWLIELTFEDMRFVCRCLFEPGDIFQFTEMTVLELEQIVMQEALHTRDVPVRNKRGLPSKSGAFH